MAMNKKTLEGVRQDLAMNLKTIRAEKGLAQERLALDAGVDRTVVSKIERAKTNPSLDVLLRLANQLDTTLDRLLQAHKPL
jgi:transcriptional regulator with XRE-family HTH domain